MVVVAGAAVAFALLFELSLRGGGPGQLPAAGPPGALREGRFALHYGDSRTDQRMHRVPQPPGLVTDALFLVVGGHAFDGMLRLGIQCTEMAY